MPPKRPLNKKTVSFSDSQTPQCSQDGQCVVPFSWKTLPVHIPTLVYSLFTQDLSPSNIVPLLTQYLYYLLVAQLLFSIPFNSIILEHRKSKPRTIKFSLSQDYSLILISLIIITLAVPPIYILLVAFGAPFTTYLPETLLLAAHITTLCLPSVVSCLKLAQLHPSFYKYFASVVIGGWLGAIAIPLDWDRPWQNWPMPIIGGAYLGATVGYTFGWVI